ncbi:DUF2946 family protein [Oryzibacter oryziterrae]|uniref:DUF2946 family protein n=1 Tax=Oryzibacter oryziterrae TaxID=2766474 RepID=UPI001F2E6DAF|nr:DUF2946 family protein [Oryzibacter oryziterrae]
MIRRSVASVLGLCAVLVNVLAVLLLAQPSAEARTPYFAGNDGQMMICAASGMIMLDAKGTPTESDDHLPGPTCVFCLPLLQGAVDAPAIDTGPAIVLAAPREPVALPRDAQPLPSSLLVDGPSPRGPPVL